jgi:hypothetical protein
VTEITATWHQWLGRAGLAAIGVSVACMAAVGALGPSAAVAAFPAASPWPPWFTAARPSPQLAGVLIWLALLAGSGGLAAALAAIGHGWRPRPRYLIAGSVLAVLGLTVLPPMGSADMLDYAVFGRITALGHSPYVMLPAQLKASGDPVGAVSVSGYENQPSRYGPLATVTELAASELAGDSAARTIFWLKAWNALAYLALVAVLDRLARRGVSPPGERARRARVHVLWSVNPLMLWAVMAGGHNDVLAAAAGMAAFLAAGRPGTARRLLGGVALGAAAAIKAPAALFGAGLAWAARRSPRALLALAAGTAAVAVPAYLVAGPASVSASAGDGGILSDYTPAFAVARVLGIEHSALQADVLGLACAGVLAVALLRRLPPGRRELPAVRVALAVMLAWLIVTPQQHGWYFALAFPLLAVFPATRLDWIVIADAAVAALAEAPRPVSPAVLHPAWLAAIMRAGYSGAAPVALAVSVAVLVWLCHTRRWDPGAIRGRHRLEPAAPLAVPGKLS